MADAVGVSDLTSTKLGSCNSRVRRGSSSSIGITLSRLCLPRSSGLLIGDSSLPLWGHGVLLGEETTTTLKDLLQQ
jgi:hypothetical protein